MALRSGFRRSTLPTRRSACSPLTLTSSSTSARQITRSSARSSSRYARLAFSSFPLSCFLSSDFFLTLTLALPRSLRSHPADHSVDPSHPRPHRRTARALAHRRLAHLPLHPHAPLPPLDPQDAQTHIHAQTRPAANRRPKPAQLFLHQRLNRLGVARPLPLLIPHRRDHAHMHTRLVHRAQQGRRDPRVAGSAAQSHLDRSQDRRGRVQGLLRAGRRQADV